MKYALCIGGGVLAGLVAGALIAAKTGLPRIGKLAAAAAALTRN